MRKDTMRRYTNLASAIHILKSKSLTLLSPEKWDDRNDAYFMQQYKEGLPAKTVLALCFARATETYHHWRVFSHGTDGVCIEFNEDLLVHAIKSCKGVEARRVTYKVLSKAQARPPTVAQLPFVKRHPYKDEKEFRLVYVSEDEEIEAKSCKIALQCIQQITLSPWMPSALVETVVETLRGIEGSDHITMHQSKLIDYEKWKDVAKAAKPLKTDTVTSSAHP